MARADGRRWRFRPPLWACVVTLLATALMITAGFWQVRRGLDKQAMQAQFQAATTQAPNSLDAHAPPGSLQAVAATARGRWVKGSQLLLDNQVRGRVPGYHVWSPLRLDGGALLIVNRGWVVQNPDRRVLPDLPLPEGEVELHGLWRSLPEPGMRLGGVMMCVPIDAAVPATPARIVEYPTHGTLACLLGASVLAGELLLSPDAPDGFVREWTVGDNGFPPARHYGYAAQWFAFAATLLVLFVKLNLKRTQP